MTGAREEGHAPPPRARPPLGQTFRALRRRNYRLYWLGLLISQTGTWMQQVAQGWLVLQLTGSPLALGSLTAAQFGPILLLSLFGGAFADRLPKRRTLLVTQSAMLAQALALALLIVTGHLRLLQLYLLAALLGLANAVDTPTRQAFVGELVGREDLPNAVALNSAVFNTTRIVGPALSGLLIAAADISLPFALNAASYLAVLVGLLLMRPEIGRAHV